MNKKLQGELLKMFKRDQESIYANIKRHNNIRNKNTKRLCQIIKKAGWPSADIVGENGEMAAWLIVQHADNNIKFQEKCLQLINDLSKTKKRKGHSAYLADRVLVNKKQKQLLLIHMD